VLCAQSAARGVRGVLDILEGEVGFGAAMSEDCDWSQAIDGLGERYNITQMTTKNHGCCGHTFAAIDATLALKAGHGLTASDISRIKVGGYSATVEICSGKDHRTPYEGKFSVPYLVATAITHGSVRLDAFSDERLTDPETSALVQKVDLYLDRDIDAEFPRKRMARVTIETHDGRVLEHFQPTRKGDPELPLSDADISEKFRELAGPVMGVAKAEDLLAACWSLDTLGSVRDLPFYIQHEAAKRA
jgi:2-methylcitrate dehydratase PrpD